MTATVTGIRRDCTHPFARHEHGTRNAYKLDGCHCTPCRQASARYGYELQVRKISGQTDWIDPTPARAHLTALREAGLGTRRIEELTRVSRSALRELARGQQETIHRDTEARILALALPTPADLGAVVPVDATGTRRRVQALMRMGHPLPQIAAHAGLTRQALDRALVHPHVQAATAVSVARTYEQLWDTAPDTSTSARTAAVTRTRTRALAAGWVAPAAWDDDAIDDPDATPAEPRAAARRGRPPVDLDEWAHLVRGGENPARAASRLNATVSTISSAAHRHDRTDVLSLLQAA